MLPIDDVADHMIMKLACSHSHRGSISHLKLQKLLYYAQAWHLGIYGVPLFEGEFQAWIHGPLNRETFDRLACANGIYCSVGFGDIRPGFLGLPVDDAQYVQNLLDNYAGLSACELEGMSRSDSPWREARRGFRPDQRCETVISKDSMKNFYSKHLDGLLKGL